MFLVFSEPKLKPWFPWWVKERRTFEFSVACDIATLTLELLAAWNKAA